MEIKVVLPEKFDLVVGDTFQLFYRGIVLAPNPYVYNIVSVCDKGSNYPRYFEYTPEEEGEHELEIFVYDANRNLLGYGKTKLVAIEPKKASRPLNVMCLGASTTAKGEWAGEAFRRLAKKGGTPEGLGFDNISFVGSCGAGEAKYEGYGGWTWETYSSISFGGVWIISDHNKTNEDQHSLWKDDLGNIWKLETIDTGWLKFLRYGHNEDKPESGKLTHFSNAVNKEDIIIDRTVYEKESPFCNHDTGKIDFKAYLEKNNIDKIDVIYGFLGTNGIYEVENPREDNCPATVKMAREFIDLVHEQMPDTKVKIMGICTQSTNGGCGANYGAVLPYCDRFGLASYALELNLQYEALSKEEKYKDFVEFVNVSGQIDAENAYPETEKPVNTRSSKTEMIGTNGVHPTYEGYMQIADAAFRNMVHYISKE